MVDLSSIIQNVLIKHRIDVNGLQFQERVNKFKENQEKVQAQRRQEQIIKARKCREKIQMKGNKFRKYNNCTFDMDDSPNSKLSTNCLKYVEKFDKTQEEWKQLENDMDAYINAKRNTLKSAGKGLLLYGGTGVGKTFAAACIANAIKDKYGGNCVFTNCSMIISDVQKYYNDVEVCVYQQFRTADLVVIDDFGAERNSSFADEITYNIINLLYNSQKAVIITTNLNPKLFSDRIRSRLAEMCLWVEVTGTDRRKGKMVRW